MKRGLTLKEKGSNQSLHLIFDQIVFCKKILNDDDDDGKLLRIIFDGDTFIDVLDETSPPHLVSFNKQNRFLNYISSLFVHPAAAAAARLSESRNLPSNLSHHACCFSKDRCSGCLQPPLILSRPRSAL